MFNKNRSTNIINQSFTNQRSFVFSLLLIGALLAFEIFNYSTTDFAMTDLLGNLKFAGLKWSTILALAFCGIDFAGIARLFTAERGSEEPMEVWYLFGAWLLAATMNALLTWWGVSIAILQHQSLGNAVIARDRLLTVVPIFVAIMVWLSRVLIIGTFSVAGEKLFAARPSTRKSSRTRKAARNATPARTSRPYPAASTMQAKSPTQQPYHQATNHHYHPAPKPASQEVSRPQMPMIARSENYSDRKYA